jgi:hypothetical protein
LALGGWLASEKGYSVGSWIVLLLLFGVLALIVLVGAPDRKSQVIIEEQNTLLKNSSKGNSPSSSKKCPFCAENIKNEAKICPHCGKNVQEYENEMKLNEEKAKLEKENIMKEKFKSLKDLFSDEEIMKNANDLRRIYGKNMYISHLKSKAKELGLGDIELNENDLPEMEKIYNDAKLNENVNSNEFVNYLLDGNNLIKYLKCIYYESEYSDDRNKKEANIIKKYGNNISPVVSNWAITVSCSSNDNLYNDNKGLIIDKIKKDETYFYNIYKQLIGKP